MGATPARSADVFFDADEMSAHTSSTGINMTAGEANVTTFGSTQTDRIPTLKSFAVDHGAFWSVSGSGTAASDIDVKMNAILGGSVVVGVFPTGATACQFGWEGETLCQSFNTSEPVDGAIALTAAFLPFGRGGYRTVCAYGGSATVGSGGQGYPGVDTGAAETAGKGNMLFVRVFKLTGGSIQMQFEDASAMTADFQIHDIGSAMFFTGSGVRTQFVSGCSRRYVRLVRDVYNTVPNADVSIGFVGSIGRVQW